MNFLPLQPFLSKTLNKMGLKKTADASEVKHIFETEGPSILGSELFSHSEFLYLKNGVIYLGAKGSHWAQHLFVQRHHILEEMQARFPELKVKGVNVQANYNEKES